jgi:23S rRNA (uracil1939-C5)-methyltransferase
MNTMQDDAALITIERIAPDGAGETRYRGRTLRVFGMLPGERGIVGIRKRKGIYWGILRELYESSPERVLPMDTHHLSSAPWQCMAYSFQARLKAEILARIYANVPTAPKPEFIPATAPTEYRTKVEFSVAQEGGALVPAFHERGERHKLLFAREGTALASPAMNAAAARLIAHLGFAGYSAGDIKTVVIRESKATGELLGVVYFLREHSGIPTETLAEGLSGLVAVYSDPRSPASVATRVLSSCGKRNLIERVAGIEFSYSWDAFFQNNVPMYERVLAHMRDALPADVPILDLYAGVGVVGIVLSSDGRLAHCVDTVASAVVSAADNAQRAGRTNVTTELLPAERFPDEGIAQYPLIIVDPPRAGLHPKLLRTLLRNPPERLWYLSCNPETQVRDFAVLAEKFSIDRIVGYDFYPQTPHLESLLLLSRAPGA